jgi:hypothetical protein
MSREEPESFMHYWSAVDAAMMKLFGIDTGDAGIEPDVLAGAQEEGQTPENFALWFGAKYGLTPLSKCGRENARACASFGRRAASFSCAPQAACPAAPPWFRPSAGRREKSRIILGL